MKAVRFWGTRGSIPVALTADGVRHKIVAALRGASGRTFANDAEAEAYVDSLAFADRGTFGGHSPCVEIETGGPDFVICDLGSGVRPFGQAALARDGGGPRTYHVFLSHVHWDHIMGLPFFTPAYIPGNRVVVYGGHAHLEAALRRQQEQPSFPVDFSTFRADISFVRLEPGIVHDVAGMRVKLKLQRHAGDSYGFRFESGGKSVVYSTDSEHDLGNRRETDGFVDFATMLGALEAQLTTAADAGVWRSVGGSSGACSGWACSVSCVGSDSGAGSGSVSGSIDS